MNKLKKAYLRKQLLLDKCKELTLEQLNSPYIQSLFRYCDVQLDWLTYYSEYNFLDYIYHYRPYPRCKNKDMNTKYSPYQSIFIGVQTQ